MRDEDDQRIKEETSPRLRAEGGRSAPERGRSTAALEEVPHIGRQMPDVAERANETASPSAHDAEARQRHRSRRP